VDDAGQEYEQEAWKEENNKGVGTRSSTTLSELQVIGVWIVGG
jgi:hypothetical protein